VISRSKGQPVELVDVVIPDPGPGEVVVAVHACGVCHTDLTYRDGGINDSYPFLLGHEAAGVVESIGEGVTQVAPGDFVILNWRAVCGECRACRRGRPWYCFNTFNATQKMTLIDGTELTPALGVGAFADKTLVHQGQCTKVDDEADAAVAGLLGCGVMAGIGAAINTGAVSRDDTVAVIGCGGVGDAAIAGAKLVGARTIIAVDTDDTKLEWAREFGATHTINARNNDVVEKIQELTDGFGADVVIDAGAGDGGMLSMLPDLFRYGYELSPAAVATARERGVNVYLADAVASAAQHRLGSADERAIVMESLTGIKRAGADLILTYFAKQAAVWLRQA
jgi:S-(hydroxymethyl)mycothiol dehydrogenase